METYIATFFSHFGALRFKKACDAWGIPARTMPVPRNLSSSCGTCTRFECGELPEYGNHHEELEAIVRVTDEGYEWLYRADDVGEEV